MITTTEHTKWHWTFLTATFVYILLVTVKVTPAVPPAQLLSLTEASPSNSTAVPTTFMTTISSHSGSSVSVTTIGPGHRICSSYRLYHHINTYPGENTCARSVLIHPVKQNTSIPYTSPNFDTRLSSFLKSLPFDVGLTKVCWGYLGPILISTTSFIDPKASAVLFNISLDFLHHYFLYTSLKLGWMLHCWLVD